MVKLYSLTFPFPQAEEASKKITIETRTNEEILRESRVRENTLFNNDEFIDSLYLTVHLPSINQPNDRFSKQYSRMDPLTPESIKPITNLRAELLHALMSWQMAKLPEVEVVDPTFLRTFREVFEAREDSFDKHLRQTLGTPGSPTRTIIKNRGFNMSYTFYNDQDRRLLDGGNTALEREIYGYLCQKVAVDNELTFAQVSYDFEPDEFLAFRGIMEGKARLRDPELFGMIMNSDIPGFINRINQAQTGVKFTDRSEMLDYWLDAFHNEMDRVELWVKLTHAFPGTKTPRIVTSPR